MSEDALQKLVAAFLRVAAPELLWFAVPNGGFRDAREAAKLKATGTRPGVADLAFVLPDGRATFIELKTATGRQSPAQKDFEALCAANQTPYVVCRSLHEVEAALRAWGVPLKSRSPE